MASEGLSKEVAFKLRLKRYWKESAMGNLEKDILCIMKPLFEDRKMASLRNRQEAIMAGA